MAFVNKIKKLTEINEVLSKTDLGNISKIRNNREMVVKYLTSFNFEGELIDIVNMADGRFSDLYYKNEKFRAGLKHTFGKVFCENSKDKRQDYVNVVQKGSILNFKGKQIDLKNVSNEEYATLLKDKSFSQTLIKHFKDKSSYRQIVLGNNEFVKDKENKLSAKDFILNKNKIYSLMKNLNNGKFKKSIVIDLETKKPDNDINNLNLKINTDKCTEILNKNGYNKIMYEIGICYDKNKDLISLQNALTIIKNSLETKLEDPDNLADYNVIEKIRKDIANIYDNSYKIIFSIEPTLTLSQSSAVDWKSCMTLIDDNYNLKQKASSSLNAGIAVVYITKVGDLAIDRPLARFLIKVATLPGFEKSKEDKYHQFHVEKMYTSSNMRSHINVPQNHEKEGSVLNKFGLKVKEIVETINKKRLKDLVDTTKKVKEGTYNSKITDSQRKELNDLDQDQISFDMSNDYYTDSGSNRITRSADYNFMEIAEKKEDFNEESIARLLNAFSRSKLNAEYVDDLMKLLIKDKKYNDLIKKIVDNVEKGNSNYNIKIDYSQIDDMDIEAYGDNIVLNPRANGKEKANITTNRITYYARNIEQGKNNLKNLKNYNINFRNTKKSNRGETKQEVAFNKQDVVFLYKYNGNDKGDFTIGDDFKFSFEIGKREISQITKIIKKNDKETEEKTNLNLKDSNSFTKKYIFSPGVIQDNTKNNEVKNQLEVKFDSNFNKNIEYDFKNCTLKFDKKTELKDNKNFKLFFTDDSSKIIMYPDNFYITVNADDSKENQIKINYKLLKDNIESNQLKQIQSNKNLLSVLQNEKIVFFDNDKKLQFKEEKNDNLVVNRDLTIDGKNIFKEYKFLQLSQATLPKNIYFVLNVISTYNQYSTSDIYHIEKIINICKIFNINYFVTINNKQEKIETVNDFDMAIFKYSSNNYEVSDTTLKIYEKNKRMNFEEIRNIIKNKHIRKIDFLKMEGENFNLSSIVEDSENIGSVSFHEVPNNFNIKIEKYRGEIELKDFNAEKLNLNITGISTTREANIIIENSNIKDLQISGENIVIKINNSRIFVNNKSNLTGQNNFKYYKSEPLFDSDMKINKISIDEVEEINIPKNFTFRDFSAVDVTKINNYENINWDNLFDGAQYSYPKFSVNLKDYSNFPVFIEKSKLTDVEKIFKDKNNIILIKSGENAHVKFHTKSIEAMLKNALTKANIKSIKETRTFKEDAIKFTSIYYALPFKLEYADAFSNLNREYRNILGKIEDKGEKRKREIINKNPIKTKIRNLIKTFKGKKKKQINDSFVSSIKRIESYNYFD